MKLAKSPGYSNHAAAIGSHADHWLISSVRTILLNTKITHRLQIIDVDAQAARGPGPCAAQCAKCIAYHSSSCLMVSQYESARQAYLRPHLQPYVTSCYMRSYLQLLRLYLPVPPKRVCMR